MARDALAYIEAGSRTHRNYFALFYTVKYCWPAPHAAPEAGPDEDGLRMRRTAFYMFCQTSNRFKKGLTGAAYCEIIIQTATIHIIREESAHFFLSLRNEEFVKR